MGKSQDSRSRSGAPRAVLQSYANVARERRRLPEVSADSTSAITGRAAGSMLGMVKLGRADPARHGSVRPEYQPAGPRILSKQRAWDRREFRLRSNFA
jgi:hypothetical protein